MAHATPRTRGRFSRRALPDTLSYYQSQDLVLKGGGAWRSAVCPFHPDTHPSLRVNIERGAYRCMVCGAHGGDVLAFHMHRHGLGFVDACKQLGAWLEGGQ